MGQIVDNAVDVGSLCFLSVRFKTVRRSVTFLENHTCCHRGKPRCRKNLKLMPSWKTTPAAFQKWFRNAERVVLCESYWCICHRCWASFSSFPIYSKPTESFVAYFPKKLKNPHLFYSYGRFPGKHSVAVKQFKRERRFRLLGHIPHSLVDDGALFPFSPSGTDTTSVH